MLLRRWCAVACPGRCGDDRTLQSVIAVAVMRTADETVEIAHLRTATHSFLRFELGLHICCGTGYLALTLLAEPAIAGYRWRTQPG